MENDFATGYALGQDNDKGNDGMMGGGFIWIILLLVLFGGNGFGGNNAAGAALTRSDLCEGFNFNNLEQGVRGVQNGLCDGFYAQNTTMLQGFNGVGSAISNLGYQMQSCCCDTNRNIDAVRYENAKNTCDIITASHADTDRIIGHLTQDKIESLRTELQSAQLQLSNAAQTQAIVDQIRPCPIPSYPTCNPWSNQVPYGGGCGCGV